MQATQTFANGCNCSQAVLGAFAPALGLAPEQAMKLACGFGGGIAHGETCGAVTGAVMVLGLRHGNTSAADPAPKQHTYQLVREFGKRFRERHATLCCRELLGCNPATPEGHAQAAAQGLFTNRCPKFVASAVEILEGMASESSTAGT